MRQPIDEHRETELVIDRSRDKLKGREIYQNFQSKFKQIKVTSSLKLKITFQLCVAW